MWEERLRKENEYKSWELAVTSGLAAQNERKKKWKAIFLLVSFLRKTERTPTFEIQKHAQTQGAESTEGKPCTNVCSWLQS